MARPAARHDRDAGGPADVLAAKAALRQEVWAAMREARVARFPGAAGRIPNFAGAEAAAERLRATPMWQAASTVKANPDSAQLPVRQRALEDGKTGPRKRSRRYHCFQHSEPCRGEPNAGGYVQTDLCQSGSAAASGLWVTRLGHSPQN